MNSSTILVTVWQFETMQNPSQTIFLLGSRPNWFRSIPAFSTTQMGYQFHYENFVYINNLALLYSFVLHLNMLLVSVHWQSTLKSQL